MIPRSQTKNHAKGHTKEEHKKGEEQGRMGGRQRQTIPGKGLKWKRQTRNKDVKGQQKNEIEQIMQCKTP